jgi:hypothetical protein
MKKLFVLLLISFGSYAQNVVQDISNVRKPLEGKLYYSIKDKGLYLYRNTFVEISKPITKPTVTIPPVFPVGPSNQDEIQLGYWAVPERILVAKMLGGQYHLLQTNASRTYYVPRGINLLQNDQTKVNAPIPSNIVSTKSELGGLYPPSNFPEAEILKLGYYKNDAGEYIPKAINPTPPKTGKITVPVGAFRWDGYYDDYLLKPRQGVGGKTYDQGINVTSGIRVDLTEFASANVVPFFGEQNLAPTSIPIINSLTYNPITDKNDFTTINKNVTCKFNLTPMAMEKEIGYAKDAGIDYWAFLWYSPYDSPVAEAAHKFIQTTNKQGLKMCYTSGPIGWNVAQNIDYMTDKMMKDYYQKIDGKPLFFVSTAWPHLSAVKASYAAKSGGGQLYVCELGEYNTYPNTSHDASSVYATFGFRESADGFKSQLPHSRITNAEIAERNKFMKNSDRDIIPCITTGAENYWKRSSLNNPPVEYWTEKASNADMDAKHEALISFINLNPRCKTIVYYSWNENHESGNPICPTLAAGTSSVNVSTINISGATAGVNRSTLDKVKQYCKK